MKVWIEVDEAYPEYTIHTEDPKFFYGYVQRDIPEELVQRFNKAKQEYDAVSEEVGAYYDGTE